MTIKSAAAPPARDGSGSLPMTGALHERVRAGDRRKPRRHPVNAAPGKATTADSPQAAW